MLERGEVLGTQQSIDLFSLEFGDTAVGLNMFVIQRMGSTGLLVLQ